MVRIEALLSARSFVAPQLVGDRIYFISNLGGQLSLYVMDFCGSVPQPLLPPDIALQNPTLMQGDSYVVFPDLDTILVAIDRDGDENYQPMVIPLEGGFPEPAFGDLFEDSRITLSHPTPEDHVVFIQAASRTESMFTTFRANMKTRELTKIGASMYGGWPAGENASHTVTAVVDAFGAGDHVVYLKRDGEPERQLLFGTPRASRGADHIVAHNSISSAYFTQGDRAILVTTSVFDDAYGLGLLPLDGSAELAPVTIRGARHSGSGELQELAHLTGNRYLIGFNIDGCDWLYEGTLGEAPRTMQLDAVLVGQGELSGGIVKGRHYDKAGDRHIFSYTTATSPTQLYTVEGAKREVVRAHTRERILGVAPSGLSAGEDASFVSYDGLRISARLYRPPPALGFAGPRPLVYYIHGGPQSQEHPDFAWFSMPLIQMLAMSGFAVFVPNVRGSTGYGFDYMNRVVRDWGGADRLDHVHAMTQVLPADPGIDARRAGVVGRSYGGFMTLTLASRHPELWSAAVDMFGPYDLLTFQERIPETWKPFMAFLVGDPVDDRDHLVERSPRTYLEQVACPLLVIQGKNDPRVVEPESAALVEQLRAAGKDVEYLMFEDEGHDVLKYENRVRCYKVIVDFFTARV